MSAVYGLYRSLSYVTIEHALSYTAGRDLFCSAKVSYNSPKSQKL